MNLELGIYLNKSVFTSEQTENHHIVILGKSGSGKTVMAQKLMLEIVEHGGTVLTFNSHCVLEDDQILNNYRTAWGIFAQSVDAYREGIGLPLFSQVCFSDGLREEPWDMVQSVVEALAAPINLGCKQRAALERACVSVASAGAYLSDGIAAIGEALQTDSSVASFEVINKLKPLFCRNVFYHSDDFLKPNRINVIHISKFDIFSQNMIEEMLLSYLWRLANAGIFKKKAIYVFIDEFQNLPCGKRATMGRFLSEGRKMGVNIILASQTLEKGNTVMEKLMQASTCLFFKPAASDLSKIAKLISTENAKIWLSELASLRVGEYILNGAYTLSGKEFNTPIRVDARQPALDLYKNTSKTPESPCYHLQTGSGYPQVL